jgi:transposase
VEGEQPWSCSQSTKTLWFETDIGDGFREPGFSKERRLDPQITVGLLTDATGMPLMIDAFEGNRAECDTRSHVVSGSRRRRHLVVT